MDFGLPEMQVVALVGLLAIATAAVWSSATLWRRQRLLEAALAELAAQLARPQEQAATAEPEDEDMEAAPHIAQLVELLKAADRSTLAEMLHTPFDLPRTPAFDVDGGRTAGGHFGFAPGRDRAGWEA
jgi:Tfp pilus assembly protein PilE